MTRCSVPNSRKMKPDTVDNCITCWFFLSLGVHWTKCRVQVKEKVQLLGGLCMSSRNFAHRIGALECCFSSWATDSPGTRRQQSKPSKCVFVNTMARERTWYRTSSRLGSSTAPEEQAPRDRLVMHSARLDSNEELKHEVFFDIARAKSAFGTASISSPIGGGCSSS